MTMVADARAGADPRPRPRAGLLPRMLVRGGPVDPSLHAHLQRHGPLPVLPRSDPSNLLTELERSGILGRGGAGFPMAKKVTSVRAQSPRAVVVANGTEGEPASDKDKVLLLQAPHLVIDGAMLAAALTGARSVVLVVPDEVRLAVQEAVSERVDTSRDPVRMEVVEAARGFVSGEASAVVSWVERRVPLPRMTPPRLAERGLQNRPTLVQNVETLAQLALVARHGAEWYRAVGPAEEPGSMLVTLCGAFPAAGVFEVAIGTPLPGLVELGGGDLRGIGALLVGGYSGAWVRAEDVSALCMSRSSLRTVGAGPGAGIVAALPRERCGLVESARVLSYLAAQSAGQCGPCVFGLDAIASEFASLAATGDADLGLLKRWFNQVDGRGACGHPDGAVRFARSAMRVFAAEVDEHRAGWCRGTSNEPVLPAPERPGG